VKSVRGMLAFIYHVKRWDDARRNVPVETIEKRAYFRVYADFLNYMWFSGQSRPTIVCEGKTDNVYIKCAIRSLAKDYPSLIKPNGKEKGFLVQLFGFTDTAEEVQKLSGGAPQLNNLLGDYRKRIANCKRTPQQPTILVVDNDSGPQNLYSHLGNILKKKVDGSEPFYWAYENLYVVPVPKIGGAHTAMENLFEKEVLDTKLGGRILDLTNKETDSKKFYSKHDFSIQVVQKKQKSIKFDGFRPFLDNIVAVQKDYASKLAAANK
jgi:hypothetical protein